MLCRGRWGTTAKSIIERFAGVSIYIEQNIKRDDTSGDIFVLIRSDGVEHSWPALAAYEANNKITTANVNMR